MKSDKVEKKYIELIKKLSGEERLKIGFQLYEIALSIAESGILQENPNMSNEERLSELRKRLFYESKRNIKESPGST